MLAKNTRIARQGRNALDITWNDTHALAAGPPAIRQRFQTLAEKAPAVANAIAMATGGRDRSLPLGDVVPLS